MRGGGLELGFDPEMGSGNGKLFSYDEVLNSELASRADVGQSLIGSKSG